MGSVTSPSTEEQYLTRARNAASVDECMSIYDKWAATYNNEVGPGNAAQDYVAPMIVAQLAIKTSANPGKSVVMDAGCGTGLVGEALSRFGAKTIDGLDLSNPMLEVARKTGVYRKLDQADLGRPLDIAAGTYDTVTCVGTFTAGHVGPDPGVRELVRICKTNGSLVATILEPLWESAGFKIEVHKLKVEGLVDIVVEELIDYVKGHHDKAMVIVLRKL